jgi:hypothetical protein
LTELKALTATTMMKKKDKLTDMLKLTTSSLMS